MEDYKSNSLRSREVKGQEKAPVVERQKIEPIASGKVKKKSKFASTFLADDIGNIRDYVMKDVLVPALKKAFSDVITNGIEMLLYGESGVSKKGPASRVEYRKYYDRGKEPERGRDYSSRNQQGYAYDEIIVATKGQALDVLSRMDELIDMYGVVSIMDLYELVGIDGGNYTDNKYGWTNLQTADSVRVRDGYLLKLPKAMPLN